MSAIYRRELMTYFISPMGYVYIALCLIMSGSSFMDVLADGSSDLSPVFFMLVIMQFLLMPFLTMRLFAEEKRLKTDQLLLTAPISIFGLVISKFSATFTVFLGTSSVSLIYAFALDRVKNVEISWRTVIGNYIALVLIGALFMAIGIFLSSLTENQMIAAIMGFVINVALFLVSYFSYLAPWKWLETVMNKISVYERFSEIAFGIIELPTLVYFFSIIVVFLFLTTRVIDARRY